MTDDPVLDAIKDGDIHDRLLLLQQEGEPIEDTIARLIDCHPPQPECVECGDEPPTSDLAETQWIATRFQVEDTDRYRTNLYCSLSCLRKHPFFSDSSTHLGQLYAASVLDDEGTATLAVKGTRGAVTVEVPEDMTVPFEETAMELDRVYDGDTEETLIGEVPGGDDA
jgi:hypothetical protein